MTLVGVLIAVFGFTAGMLTMHLYLQHKRQPAPVHKLHITIPRPK